MTTLNECSGETLTLEQRLLQIKEGFVETPTLPQRSKWVNTLKFIPLLTGLGNSIMGTGSGIAQLIALGRHVSDALRSVSHSLAHVSQYGGIALALLDFIRVPSIYLASWIMGEKSSVTLSKNARWFYATLLLGLAIAAFTVPAAAAPIALVTGILGVGVSVFTLAWTLKRRHESKKELKKIDKTIEDKNAELEIIKEKALNIKDTLNKARQNNELVDTLDETIKKLHAEFVEKSEALQRLYVQKAKFEKKLNKRNLAAITDKTVGVALSTLALTGLMVYFFFPPVGIAIMTASAGMGTLYITARVTFPLVNKLAGWIRGKSKKNEAQQTINHTNSQEYSNNSTAIIVRELQTTQSAQIEQPAIQDKPEEDKSVMGAASMSVKEIRRGELKKEPNSYSFFSIFPFKLFSEIDVSGNRLQNK